MRDSFDLFESICQREENSATDAVSEHDEIKIREEAVAALLYLLFRPTVEVFPSPYEVSLRAHTLCHSVRPDLLGAMSLEEIGKRHETSKQTISKRTIKQDEELGIHSRTRRSDRAVSVFKEGTEKWWAEKKEKERQERRKAQQKAYRERNREKIKERDRAYYQANKARKDEYSREYRKENRERVNELARKRYLNHAKT